VCLSVSLPRRPLALSASRVEGNLRKLSMQLAFKILPKWENKNISANAHAEQAIEC